MHCYYRYPCCTMCLAWSFMNVEYLGGKSIDCVLNGHVGARMHGCSHGPGWWLQPALGLGW